MAPAGQPLHRRDLVSLELHRQGKAAQHRSSVDEHGTGTALPQFAPVLGPGKPQVLAQHLEERLVHRHDQVVVLSVDPEPERRLHAGLLLPPIDPSRGTASDADRVLAAERSGPASRRREPGETRAHTATTDSAPIASAERAGVPRNTGADRAQTPGRYSIASMATPARRTRSSSRR